MKNLIFICLTFTLVIFLGGCGVIEESAYEVNNNQPINNQPMDISISKESQEFRIYLPVSSGMVAWDSVCLIDEDCTYVQNPPGRDVSSCVNLNNIQDISDLIIDETIPCACEPLVLKVPTTYNGSVWFEDQGSPVCRTKEDRPDLAIQKFEVMPISPTVNERVVYNTTIKNIGTAGCSMIDTIINFGDGSGGWIKMSWCTHYGYTPEQCREMGYEPFFNPGETVINSIDWRYTSTGIYNITVMIMCQQSEFSYDDNQDSRMIAVS